MDKTLTTEIRRRAQAVGIGINELHRRAGIAGNALWRWEHVVDKPRQSMVERVNAVLEEMENK